MASARLAAIDLGTVSSRLLCATMRDGAVVDSRKRTVITDLGEGVDASGAFASQAIDRVAHACAAFIDEARSYGATCTCTTLTSAARDAANGRALLDRLRVLGLDPQAISGDTEARLTFYGVARDVPNERIAVADSGGGSTEFAIGEYVPGRRPTALTLESTCSLDIGCRRVTERFFQGESAPARAIDRAAAWMRPQLDGYWAGQVSCPGRLLAVGGTVTSLVAMTRGLEVYDSSLVHLRELSIVEVERAIDVMCDLDVNGIAALPGIQQKRAPVILAGAVIVRELMRSGGYERLTVSENSLLIGAAATMHERLCAKMPAVGWEPRLAAL